MKKPQKKKKKKNLQIWAGKDLNDAKVVANLMNGIRGNELFGFKFEIIGTNDYYVVVADLYGEDYQTSLLRLVTMMVEEKIGSPFIELKIKEHEY